MNKKDNSPSEKTCWICLSEEPEDGEPPVRDCACRGDSSGFVHIACLKKYARSKLVQVFAGSGSKENKESVLSGDDYLICSTCKQHYEGDMAITLSEAFLEDAEKEHEGTPDRLRAVCRVTAILQCADKYSLSSDTQLIDRAASLYEILMQDASSYPLIKAKAMKGICFVYVTRKNLSKAREWKKRATDYFGRNPELLGRFGFEEDLNMLDLNIRTLSGDRAGSSAHVEQLRELLQEKDADDENIVRSKLVLALIQDGQLTEALIEQKKVVRYNFRVYGPRHIDTAMAQELYEKLKSGMSLA